MQHHSFKLADGAQVTVRIEMTKCAKCGKSRVSIPDQPGASRFAYRMCFYDPDGQYVGSSYSDDLAALDRQCQNFKELHPGAECSLCES